ncbi:MAG: SDR family oxidoreductase, partial [Clostridiales bacterium]|nr:SDR family oxidoreductase [Clostridiales bacterium]
GISDFTIPAVRLTDEGWQKSISINQTGTFYYCREALKYMEKAGSGSIINVSSVGGVYAIAGLAYSATKAAVLAITKNIAIQYAGTNIRCNAVCPGATNTGMMNPDVEKLFDKEMWDIVQKRADPDIAPVEPIDQANAMLFFASDESRYVTGQTIVVDHGKFL